MKQIAKFYTIFWIIYFPICIAFVNIFKMDYSDEMLTLLMVFYAFSKNKILKIPNRRKQEIKFCAGVFVFYLIYSWFIRITTDRGILLDIAQETRPYLVFYLTWILAPEFTERQKKLIKWVMLISFFGSLFLAIVAPFLYMKYDARSVLEGGESAGLGQIAINCAMIYYLFSKHTKKNLYFVVFILLISLVSGKSKFYGECVAFIYLLFFVKSKINFKSPKFLLRLSILTTLILYFTWTKFNSYYIEGFEDDTEMMARPATYKTSIKIMTDYIPFGSGFGTFGCAAAAKEYSPLYYKYNLSHIWGLSPQRPMFLADAFYPVYIAQFGIFGVILFFIFWKRRTKEMTHINNIIYYRMALMCMLALAIEQTADSSYLSGKGMGYFMILALCLNSNKLYFNQKLEQNRKN